MGRELVNLKIGRISPVKLSPLEIRKQSFRVTMRGFDREEVQIFLDMIADEHENVMQENGMLSEKIRYQNERLEEYHTLEKTLQNSILMAERVASESREQARIDAENMINDANVRAERILADSRGRLHLLGEQVVHLSQQKDAFVQKFQALLDAQSQFLLTHREDLNSINELSSQTRDLIRETSTDYEEVENLGDRDEPISGAEEAPHYEKITDEANANGAFINPAIADSVIADDLATAETITDTEPDRDFALESESPAYDGPRINRATPPPAANSIMETAPEARDAEDKSGFFAPKERREGFFELNAEEGAQK